MASNDLVLIDGIIEERKKMLLPSYDNGEVFELFAAEQFVKNYDLTYNELLDCCVDGRNDGGIDFVFIFINGHLLQDAQEFVYPKTNAELEIIFMTCKHMDSFKLQPVDSIYASLCELLDFRLKADDFSAEYNEGILNARERMIYAYKRISLAITEMKINVVYASRGTTSELAENIRARSNQVKALINKSFSGCKSEFVFWGDSEILERYRKIRKTNIELPIVKSISKGTDYIILTKLKDYFNFVTDEEGLLRRYLFDSNVRDYLGENRVNSDILNTLQDENSQDFWLLNNGVTILVSAVQSLGDVINLHNVQIVNGLQTTQSIFSYFSSGHEDKLERCILIKIIKTLDENIRDEIIRATNNQTNVELSLLNATDKIQRDIDEILLSNGIYYERKKKFYENQGVPKESILSPLNLAEGYVSLILKLPHSAVSLKNRFMTIPEQYGKVFSEKVNLRLWPQIAKVYFYTEKFLNSKKNEMERKDKLNKTIRSVLAFFAISKMFGKYSFSIDDLINLCIDDYSDHLLNEVWTEIKRLTNNGENIYCLRNYHTILDLCDLFSDISNVEVVKYAVNPFLYNGIRLEDELLDNIVNYISLKGWYRGINKDMAKEFNCLEHKVFQAVQYLIMKNRLQPR